MIQFDLELSDKRPTYVRVSEDNMEAYVYLDEPNDGKEYTVDDVLALLREKKVEFGYIDANIIAMTRKQVYEREIKVAEGLPAMPGKQGSYHFYFDENEMRQPSLKEDGSVDYSSMSVLEQIAEGDVIAEYIPPVKGINGKNVFGQAIVATAGKELPPLKGKGFHADTSNPNRYIADVSGKIEYKDGKIDIKQVHVIEGDVSYITGKVEFFGDVIINGNIDAGVIIRAGKSLTVSGTVEGAQIYCGGDIILKRGIQGGGRGNVVVKGNIYADFIEHSTIKARGSVHANVILNSIVESDDKVIVSGRRGFIVGGNVHGMKGITATEIGNQIGVKTVVHAGNTAETIKEWNHLALKEKRIKVEIQEVGKEVQRLLSAKKRNGPSKLTEERLRMCKEHLVAKQSELLEAQTDKKPVVALMEEARGAEIIADGNIYQGVVVEINTQRYIIANTTCYMKYTNIGGVIEGTVLCKN